MKNQRNNNAALIAINQHCTSMIEIMGEATLTLTNLRTLQKRFQLFVDELEKAIVDVQEDVKENVNQVIDEAGEPTGEIKDNEGKTTSPDQSGDTQTNLSIVEHTEKVGEYEEGTSNDIGLGKEIKTIISRLVDPPELQGEEHGVK